MDKIMLEREQLLRELQEAVQAGTITQADVQSVLSPVTPQAVVLEPVPIKKPNKLSAVDVMFYVAGLVLFSAIVSMIVQSWNDGNPFVHILLSAGVGSGLWSLAHYLIKSPAQSDLRTGLINSLLLTGSLSIVTGGYIIINELIGGFGELNLIPGAIMLAVIAAVHIGFDRLISRDLILLLGVILGVASFPALLFGVLENADISLDVRSLIFVVTAGLLAYATRALVQVMPERANLKNSFDSLAAFVALGAMYVANFSDYGVIWAAVLIAAIIGAFYLSILSQDKRLLGSASFFLVLTVITIAFKYFSGYGITTSLVISAVGLLGSAAAASSIRKQYFDDSKPNVLRP